MSPLTDDERDGLVETLAEVLLRRAMGGDFDEYVANHRLRGRNMATCNDATCRRAYEPARELATALEPILEAHYEAGLVEGSMIGDADVAEVRERGL